MIWEYASIWAVAKETGLEPYVPNCIMKAMLEIFEKPSVLSMEHIANCPVPKHGGFVQYITEWSCKNQVSCLLNLLLSSMPKHRT